MSKLKGGDAMKIRHKLRAYKEWLWLRPAIVAERALATLKLERTDDPNQWMWIRATEEVIRERRAGRVLPYAPFEEMPDE
jgi:hypothetical protein